MEILGGTGRDGTGRYFSRQNSWRDGTGGVFSRRDGAVVVFFPKRDGGDVFFFRGGTGRLYFFSEAGRGGCNLFSRRDGTGWLCFFSAGTGRLYFLGFTYLQSMDFQRESQSKHHLYCKQEKPAHCHGSLLLRLGTHQIQNRTRDAHKISPHGMTKRTPAMN